MKPPRRAGWFARAAARRKARRAKRPVRRAWVEGATATINAGRKGTPAQTRAYFERIRDSISGRDITTLHFQEIDGGDVANEHQLLREVFTEADGWHLEGMGTQTPILWRDGERRWELAGPEIVDHVMAGIPRQSPGRSVVVVVLQEIDGDGLLVLINTHFPIGYRDHRAPAVMAKLLAGWADVQAAVKRYIRLGRRYEGDTIATADTNRNYTPAWFVRQVLATAARLIDRIVLAAGRGRIAKVLRMWTIPNGIGEPFHPARCATWLIHPRKKEKTR